MCLTSPIARNEVRQYLFRWLNGIVICSVGILSRGIMNVSSRNFIAYDGLYDIIASGAVSCISSREISAFGHMLVTSARLYLNVTQCIVLPDSRRRRDA